MYLLNYFLINRITGIRDDKTASQYPENYKQVNQKASSPA